MMKLLTINGPLGSGKTWVAKQLAIQNPGVAFVYVSFQYPLKAGTMCMLGLDPDTEDYDKFKVTDYFGMTGRQWMIHFATAARSFDPVIWSRVMHSTMRQVIGTPIFVADSNGFEDELDYFYGQGDVNLYAASIEPPEYKDRRGLLYSNSDSRYNLAHRCHTVGRDSNEVLAAVTEGLRARNWIK